MGTPETGLASLPSSRSLGTRGRVRAPVASLGPKIRLPEQRLTSVGRSELKGEKETPQTFAGSDEQTRALVAFSKE